MGPSAREGPGIPNNHYKLGLEYLEPVFSLPQLEELSLFGVDVNDAVYQRGQRAGPSSIRHLTLVNNEYSTATAEETQTILAVPKALVSLSFYQNDCGLIPPGADEAIPLRNADLYTALKRHKQSLEYLDIY